MTEDLATNVNFTRLCRCCALEHSLMYDIFCGTCSNAQTYYEVIVECAPVQLFKDDGLPSLVCHECVLFLESFITFRKKCIESESVLNRIRYSTSPDQQEVFDLNRVKQEDLMLDNIKEEPNDVDNTTVPEIESDDLEKNSVDRSDSEVNRRLFENTVYIKEQHVSDERDDTDRTDQRTYSCDRCDKSFKRKSILNKHRRVHTGEKPYSCDDCNKSFGCKWNLGQHRKIHTGEKPYSCERCGKSYTSKSTLNQHHKVHTGERPHSCDECGKSFNSKSTLNQHQKIHMGEKSFSCGECGKLFHFKSNLNQHRRTHTDEKPYSCDKYLQTITGSSDRIEIDPLDIDEEAFDLLQLDEEDEFDAEIVISDHDTDTEQSQSEYSDDDRLNCENDNNDYLVGRDNITRWELNPPDQKVDTKEANIITRLKGSAKEVNSIDDIWKLFFPPSTIQEIVTYTNVHLEKLKTVRTNDVLPTNVNEIYALIGMLFLIGLKHGSHRALTELWCADGTAPDIFRAAMSLKRFYLLLTALQFDDVGTREERKTYDNLAPIRKFSDDFIERCRKLYTPGVFLTVEETLEKFRGRCKFRQFVADKPAKCGIRMYALVDSKTFYTLNVEIDAGDQPEGPYRRSNSPFDLVKRLSAPVLDTGRNLTMDSRFTSLPLARDLLVNHKTTTVGAIRRKTKELPRAFLYTKKRSVGSSRFAFFSDCTLVSYVPSKNKNLLVLSTMHRSDKIDAGAGPKTKPEIITFYDAAKGGVDAFDKLKRDYTTARDTKRWPMAVFYSFLNISGINAQVLYDSDNSADEKSSPNLTRFEFLKKLAIELIRPHLVCRAKGPRLSVELRQIITRIVKSKSETDAEEDPIDGAASTEFCSFCPRRKNRRTKKKCGCCSVPICNEHSAFLCMNCEIKLVEDVYDC